MQVAMNEFKAGLSRYVARARNGEVIDITSHDKLVARLSGVTTAAGRGVAALIADGTVRWNGAKPPLRVPVELPSHPTTMSDIVAEDRG